MENNRTAEGRTLVSNRISIMLYRNKKRKVLFAVPLILALLITALTLFTSAIGSYLHVTGDSGWIWLNYAALLFFGAGIWFFNLRSLPVAGLLYSLIMLTLIYTNLLPGYGFQEIYDTCVNSSNPGLKILTVNGLFSFSMFLELVNLLVAIASASVFGIIASLYIYPERTQAMEVRRKMTGEEYRKEKRDLKRGKIAEERHRHYDK